jgi:pre-mycofactocin synthase
VGAGRRRSGGVEYVLDIVRSGIDSALLGLGHSSVQDLSPANLLIPEGFWRELGAEPGLTQS